MGVLSLRLPDSLHRKVRELAATESILINQFVATAVAEKMAALLTEERIDLRREGNNPKPCQVKPGAIRDFRYILWP
ncbi:MAG: toxin-antitoxin system HicB family antitoxin [Acidobacteria bacterium]|nr:toxin-antitoxin system HicB family antitoxin [Acidobacteriota bacterium]